MFATHQKKMFGVNAATADVHGSSGWRTENAPCPRSARRRIPLFLLPRTRSAVVFAGTPATQSTNKRAGGRTSGERAVVASADRLAATDSAAVGQQHLARLHHWPQVSVNIVLSGDDTAALSMTSAKETTVVLVACVCASQRAETVAISPSGVLIKSVRASAPWGQRGTTLKLVCPLPSFFSVSTDRRRRWN